MPSPVRPILHRLEPTASPQQLAALTDDLLAEIFLRVASRADLARASTACSSFRRLIADPIFLRRYCRLHPPLFLGFAYDGSSGFQPVEAPHPNAPAARALASAADFSSGYLPRTRWPPWYFQGVGDGRVLFRSNLPHEQDAFPDLAVGDPLYRRYLLLPHIPVGQVKEQWLQYFEAVFAPSGDEDDDTSFRLIVTAHYAARLVVLVFNSASSSWSVGTSISWDALCFAGLTGLPMLWRPCSVYGCIYWKIDSMSKLLKLDMNRMEFSAVDLPPDHDEGHVVVVEAGEDRLGMFSRNKSDTFLNYYTRMHDEGQWVNEWQKENVIPLPVHNGLRIIGAPQKYIFLLCYTKIQDAVCTSCFSLEIKTSKIESVCLMSGYFNGHPYFGFPPSMSLRRI